MSFAGTWMNLETIILSKLTQEQKTKHRMFSLLSDVEQNTYTTHWSLLWGGVLGEA